MAEPIACDATAGSASDAVNASRTMGAEEDDPVQRRLRDVRAWLISASYALAADARAGPPKAEAERRRRPAARPARRLDLPATDPARYRWDRVSPADLDAMTPTRKLLHVLDDRTRWQTALAEVRRCAEQASDLSAMGTARNARPSAPGNRSGLTMEGRGGSLAW